MCIFPRVDGRVDGNGPHGGRIAIAVAIVVLTSITGSPDIDVAQTMTALIKFRKYVVRGSSIYYVIICGEGGDNKTAA